MRRNKPNHLISIILSVLSVVFLLFVPNIIMIQENLQTTMIIAKDGLMLLLLLALIGYLVNFHKNIFKTVNKLFLYVVVNLVVLVPFFLLIHTEIFWLIPLSTSAMIIAIMLDEGLGLITNLFLTLLLALIGDLGIDFILFNAISGTIASLLITKAKERQKIFYVSLYLMVLNVILILFVNLLWMDLSQIDLQQVLLVVLNANLAIIITTGSLPVWETLFNITTSYKLLELTNSNQKLLKRLMLEAPGTYHHSLMVANLAETAALDIGINALLCRTGALYHDIGKLKNPEYFIENQNGYNPHDELAPDSSAKVILSHVEDGVKLAIENKLPDSIVEIIRQHQGDSLVKYFYEKAKRNSDGFDVDESEFRYSGPKPATNEAAIVMLADCVEAYVRSVQDKNYDMIQTMIQDIFHSKFIEGQLNGCQLMVSELPVIANAFCKVYNGMYHERIKYTKE